MANDTRKLKIDVTADTTQADAALKKTEAIGEKTSNSITGSINKSFAGINAGLAMVQQGMQAIQGLVDLINESVGEAAEAEEAQLKLNAVAADSVDLINEYADAMSKRLGIDNDVFVEMAGKISAYTGLRGEELKLATQLAIQYGGLKGSMEGADVVIARFIEKGTLKGFNIGLTTAADVTDRLNEGIALTSGGLAVLDAHMTTTAGKLDAYKTSVQNLKEAVGRGILESESGKARMGLLQQLTAALGEAGKLKEVFQWIADWVSSFQLGPLLGPLVLTWMQIKEIMGWVKKDTDDVEKGYDAIAKTAKDAWKPAVQVIKEEMDGIAEAQDKAANALKEQNDRIDRLGKTSNDMYAAAAAEDKRREAQHKKDREYWDDFDKRMKASRDARIDALSHEEELEIAQRDTGLEVLEIHEKMLRQQLAVTTDKAKQAVIEKQLEVNAVRQLEAQIGIAKANADLHEIQARQAVLQARATKDVAERAELELQVQLYYAKRNQDLANIASLEYSLKILKEQQRQATFDTVQAEKQSSDTAKERLNTEKQITREKYAQAASTTPFGAGGLGFSGIFGPGFDSGISASIPYTTPNERARYAQFARGAGQSDLDALQALQARAQFEAATGAKGGLPYMYGGMTFGGGGFAGGATGAASDIEALIQLIQMSMASRGNSPAGTDANPIKVKIVGGNDSPAVA